ncbi:MAG: DUF479 domain-containing protein [Granulosicoccus sp.]|nr:DUF479 domain-containing protein [Granulosicoccus sp.]
MNFLAHSMFARQQPEIIVGQFCGDFVRGGKLEQFPEQVRAGIRLHREIDQYTDRHPVNLEARRLFKPPYRRFAGVLTDVVYDHYLARSWSEYSDRPLRDHVDDVYEALRHHFEVLPLDLQRFARMLIDQDILASYLSFDAVELALSRISRRSERFLLLEEASEVVKSLDSQLSAHFERFYPDLIIHMQNQQ